MNELYAIRTFLEIILIVLVLSIGAIVLLNLPRLVNSLRWAILNMGANRQTVTPPPAAPKPEATALTRAPERNEIVMHNGFQVPDDFGELVITERKIIVRK